MSVASVDYGGMEGAVRSVEKACLAWYWVYGDTETAESAMAAEVDDSAMDCYCATDKATELGVERVM